ncbi:hypothetical protein [Dechloromonas sp. ZS-1]
MKKRFLLAAACLMTSLPVLAAKPVRVDVYLGGQLEFEVELAGLQSGTTLSPTGKPETTLEMRLVAPEPIILDIKEVVRGAASTHEATARVKLVGQGESIQITDLKGSTFQHPFVLKRPE